ncbi:MAG: T9SS type A sorting domain-containing protein, partial [Bacteroidales bacterium]|nr:T9SS type A sorting domain-containing protein [Bacteroidales bacterium]
PYDDTLIYEYISGRISLPIDEDFSSGIIPIEQFASEAVNPKVETNVWMPYTDTDGKIVPPEGSGMIIRYAGNGKRGAMTKLTVRQLDLSGSVDPKLEFWYYYDSTANPLDDSYTEIRIVKDYVPAIVLNLLKKDDTYGYGWHLHTVNLNPYKDGECVLIEFESMNKYDLSSQYMSHLQITSTPDLEVFDILISPEMTACDMDNKDIQVVLRTTANQGMDFVNNPTSIAVEIPGMQITPYILQDAIAGNSMDTVTVATGIDLTTVTDIKVYLTAPVDNYSDNDTAFRELDYNPELELTVISATGNGSCYKKGISVYQRVALKNSGDMDLFGIKMQLILTAGDNFTDTVNEPGTVDLLKDSTLLYDFASSYIVPEEDYTVKVIAWLECAPGRVDVIHAAGECVDLHNLSLISIDSPLDNQIDTMGTTQQISVTLQNTDVLNAFENVDITALVESKQGQVLQTITEVLPRVEPSASPAFTFSEKYTVPSDSLYIVRVYISSGDLYTENDTLFVQGQSIPADTNVGIAYHGNLSGFSLEQNIPNPANNSTRIDYSIPTADDVMFYVHSVNGQLLYAEKISTPRGTHTIELNTAMFAAGIYFYSIEYKGQKRVKKLTINN